MKPFSQYCSRPSAQAWQCWQLSTRQPTPDRIADLEPGDVVADRADVADDLVAGHAGIERAAPFGADRVQVGMADAAKGDVDLDVVRAGRAALDVHRLERLVGRRRRHRL